jgi:tetratricopeptide (TPR) repeat protein
MRDLYERGCRLFEESKYSEAESLFKEIINKNPQYADVHNKLGIISHFKGDFQKASEYFKKALELNPKYTEASLNLSITYNEMGEFKKAQEVFFHAAQIAHPAPATIDPFVAGKLANEHYKVGNLYLELGMSYYMKGLKELALEEWKSALESNPDLIDAEAYLRLLEMEEE